MRAIHIYRMGRFFYLHKVKPLARFFHLLNYLLHNSSIPPACRIGKGSRFGHSGIGVVINSRAEIGEHCLIGQGVTIGGQGGKTVEGDLPVIEDSVFIGPGARVLGPFRVGHESIIGANAAVVKDVEPYSVMAGVPARRIARITEESFETRYKFYHGPLDYLREEEA